MCHVQLSATITANDQERRDHNDRNPFVDELRGEADSYPAPDTIRPLPTSPLPASPQTATQSASTPVRTNKPDLTTQVCVCMCDISLCINIHVKTVCTVAVVSTCALPIFHSDMCMLPHYVYLCVVPGSDCVDCDSLPHLPQRQLTTRQGTICRSCVCVCCVLLHYVFL